MNHGNLKPGHSLEISKKSSYLCQPNPDYNWEGTKNIPGRYIKFMLIIDSKDCENIDKALKKYKKKFEKSKVLLQLRERQSFTKPSVRRRGQVLKAIYKQKIASGKIEE
jgi:small subunit ribosomal protein S21